ncbi:unnamed protein product [Agarophyton chilense]
MRGLVRLFSGREWPTCMILASSDRHPHKYSKSKLHLAVAEPCERRPDIEQVRVNRDRPSIAMPHVKRKFSKLLLPVTVRLLLLAAEFGAITAGTNSLYDVKADVGFDVRLAILSDATPKFSPDLENTCDNFLISARGESNAGELLRCVSVFSTFKPPGFGDENITITFTYNSSTNEHLFWIHRSFEASISNVRVQVLINSLTGEVFNLAPLRPDVQLEHSLRVFKSVLRGAINRLGVQFDGNLTLHPDDSDLKSLAAQNNRVGKAYFRYSLLPSKKDVSHAEMASAVREQLRILPLERNSSGAPWVHEGEAGYRQNGKVVIATIGLNRMAHGALLIVVVMLWLIRVLISRWVGVGFEGSGYVVCQQVLENENTRDSVSQTTDKAGVGEMHIRRFAHERTGHLGYIRTDDRQVVVSSFESCETVI